MKITKKLQEWLDKNDLALYELLNLSFVPKRTMEGILDENTRYIAALFRLYHVTGLDEFKLSAQELNLYYQKLQEKNDYANDEMICKFLTDRFRQIKVLPQEAEALMRTKSKKNDKRVITHYLMSKYFGKTDHAPANSKEQGSVNLELANNELFDVLGKPYYDINLYRQKNKDLLRKLLSNLNLMFEGDPKSAMKRLELSKSNFNNLNSKTNDRING